MLWCLTFCWDDIWTNIFWLICYIHACWSVYSRGFPSFWWGIFISAIIRTAVLIVDIQKHQPMYDYDMPAKMFAWAFLNYSFLLNCFKCVSVCCIFTCLYRSYSNNIYILKLNTVFSIFFSFRKEISIYMHTVYPCCLHQIAAL